MIQTTNEIKVIGIAGLARSGKDTFVSIAKKILQRNGYIPVRIAFADSLKKEVSTMLLANNFQVNIMTDDTAAKKLIRPLLVWWGCQRRSESPNGNYWISVAEQKILDESIQQNNKDKVIFLISDVRFPNELGWIHNTFNGEVIHLRKYTSITYEDHVTKEYDAPPNEEEQKNDPIVQAMANQKIEWESSSEVDILSDPKLNFNVLYSLNKTKFFSEKLLL